MNPVVMRSVKDRFAVPVLMAALGLMVAGQMAGQTFKTLHSFAARSTNSSGVYTNNEGAFPQAGLILTNNTLYGTAVGGGGFGNGTVFAVYTDGTGFTNLHNFTPLSVPHSGTNSDGANPEAGLILSGNTVYGMAPFGGSFNSGTVFAVSTNGTGFTNLHNFIGSDGGFPEAGVILSGNTLYGTASDGGTWGNGTVLAINTDGTGFTNLYSFTATPPYPGPFTNSDGLSPQAGLLLSGNTLYGTASRGGTPGSGTVFAINTDGSGFTNLYSFPGPPFYGSALTNTDGAYPLAALILSGDTLYGTANTGGGESHTGVCYGNGLYVAVGAYNGVFTSGDALHWIQKTCAPPASAGKIAYGNGIFVGTGLMSVDGTNWSGVTLPDDLNENIRYNGIGCQNGTFLVAGTHGHVATSSNGSNWVSQFHGTVQDLYGVTYGSNEWISVGFLEEATTSTNGIDWMSRRAFETGTFTSVAYNAGLFVATDNGEVWTTSDTENWNYHFKPGTPWFYSVVNGNGTWVAVGVSGLVWSSVDGTNWQTQSSGTTLDLTGIAYSQNHFVTVGDQGIILTSSDGIAWTPQNSGTTAHLNGICFGQNCFVAVGVDGTILMSKDGSAWTQIQNPYANAVLTGIAYGGGYFVAAGYGGLILTSPEGMHWTQEYSPTGFDLLSVAYGKNDFLIVGLGGVILQSIAVNPFVSISSAKQLQNGAFQLTLVGTPWVTNIVQMSPDLKTWSTLATLFNTNGTLQYSDFTATNSSNRFYRIMVP